MKTHDYRFKKAVAVWAAGREREMNLTVDFTAEFEGGLEDVVLCAAASCSYIILVNGKFVAHGPARTAHGYYRVDEISLDKYLRDGKNIVAVRVAGYNVNSFSYLDQPSFLCAEIVSGDKVLAYTSENDTGFSGYEMKERIQRVQRYSFQRTFTESYELNENAFFAEYGKGGNQIQLECVGDKNYIYRDIPYGDYERIIPLRCIQSGKVSYSEKQSYYNAREISNIYEAFKGYKLSELEYASHIEVGKMDFSTPSECELGTDEIKVDRDSYVDVDMGKNYTGIFELEFEFEENGTLFLLFDEVMHKNNIDCFRLGTSSIVAVRAAKGVYKFVGAEPYVMKYVRIVAKDAGVTIKNFRLIKIAFPQSRINAEFVGDDAQMRKIYDAAVETFCSNAADIYMDCPSRERAGWLCDSYFTSKVEYALTGKSEVEKAFLENFLMPEKFEFLPDGMLPMCYPSDHNDGVFIPNWAMWYVLELENYYKRSSDKALIANAKDRVYGLLDYFRQFENEYGLLESLKSWVFVEWSKANELVQDVSFASNMLYASFKSAVAKLYNDGGLLREAEELRNIIRKMALTESGFYCDNAYRRDGKLVLSGERTEACQYYAFFCDVATPQTDAGLWKTLVEDFGYDRAQTGKYPEIYPANAFIGNYLRLDLLCRYGYFVAFYYNIKGYFTYMADKTGTLWENVGDYASCNHGFASYVIYWMREMGIVK